MNIFRWRKRLKLWLLPFFLTSILLGACTPKADPAPSASSAPRVQAVTLQPGSLEPGIGIKEVKLGHSQKEVESSLGKPASVDTNEFVKGQSFLLYPDKGIELTLQSDKVEMITLHAELNEWKAYTGATGSGVGVGSTADEVLKALGPAEEEAPSALKYPSLGLIFRFDGNREVQNPPARVESVSLVLPEKK